MEMYVWMGLGALAVGFLAKTYWDVYRAWRAYVAAMPLAGSGEVLAAPARAEARPAGRAFSWLAVKGDRFLHALLMSPTARP